MSKISLIPGNAGTYYKMVFKTGLFFFLKMVHSYRNMLEMGVQYLY